ncbi:MAG: class I SAM-dependent methyltransferase [Gammaproteobacteria bacterium]|nr:class I SAM-dependent methyltransferase [Gammaproteobacteria bacterium]
MRPTAAAAASGRQRAGVAQRLVEQLLHALGDPPVRLQLWNGSSVTTSTQPTLLTLRIANRSTLWRLMTDPEMQFGEAYTDGRIDVVEGDFVRGLAETFRHAAVHESAPGLPARWARARMLMRRNTLRGSRRNIHAHYDLGNDFYRLWLDPTMSYTCAYFAADSMTLHEAQVAKMDHVCRKLRLRAGEEVIEAGCGWGGLALHMAARYGVRVRAFNISAEQIEYARAAAQRAGLATQVEFVHDDYRNITGSADAFASIGMLEHVGVGNYGRFGRVIRRTLRPGGRALVHSIGRDAPRPLNRWMERYIFPGACPPSPAQMSKVFEPAGLSVLDVENLRLHYARTAGCWLAAFERSRGEVERMFDARFVRLWRMYLAGTQAAFLSGDLQLFQVLVAPGRSNEVPLTREHLYRTGPV